MSGRRHLGVAKIGKHGRRAKHLLLVQAECSPPISTMVLVMEGAGFSFKADLHAAKFPDELGAADAAV